MLPRAVGPACRPLACCNGQDTSSCSAGTWPSDLHDGRSIGGALKTPAQTCRLDSPLLTCWEGAARGLAPPHAAAAATLMQCQARSAHVYARGGSHSSDLARLRMLDSHEQARRPAASESVRSVRLSQHGPGFSGQLRPSLRVSHASRPLCICNCHHESQPGSTAREQRTLA